MSRIRLRRGVVLASLLVVVGGIVSVGSAPAASERDAWSDITAELARLAPETAFLAAEVSDGDCAPIAAVGHEREIGIASTFKLYVLGELARQVAVGRATWDEQLPVSDRWKSKPSGEMRYESAGTRHTLRYYAERMIAESDNTATDHLIARLGRENVEAIQPVLGHRAPELNVPLLMTREFFALKTASDEDPIDRYLRASDEEQRRMLEREIAPAAVAPEGWGDWSGPERIDLEWFASADDVCRALAGLDRMSDRPELRPLTQILGLNRGGTLFDRSTWPYAGFKMGSEAGVYNLTWLLGRDDGRRFVVTAGFNDPVNGIDQAAVWHLMERVETMLATTR